MKIPKKLKNTVLAGLASLTLTACGGGGGAGTAVGTISNWVNNDLTELNSSYVTRWTDLISLANSKISEQGEAGAVDIDNFEDLELAKVILKNTIIKNDK